MWLIPKPTTMWHYLQSLLRRSTIYKNRYDATLFTKSVAIGTLKSVATQQYFTKSQNHFYKAQILIWHLFSQNRNSYLASSFTKPKFLFGIYFHKAQILIWHYFTKPKYYFGNYLYTIFIKAQMLIWHQLLQSPNANLASIFTKPKY